MNRNPVVWCLLIVCMAILTFTLLTWHSLCELRIRNRRGGHCIQTGNIRYCCTR
ncbi:Hok/Gef family protein [Salmonella enterica subsp. enterica serovar Colindale]|nr:Hok/Gef family protein [Salmonella enterica subsp. enterica serovar Colindale]